MIPRAIKSVMTRCANFAKPFNRTYENKIILAAMVERNFYYSSTIQMRPQPITWLSAYVCLPMIENS